MSNRFLGGLGQKPSHISEQKTGGVRGEVGIPILQALAIAGWLPVCLSLSLWALWCSGPVIHWAVAAVVGAGTILYHIIYEEETWQRLAQALISAALVGLVVYSTGRLLSWAYQDAREWARNWVVALWCAVPGAWLGFGLLLVAFAWELFLRSPAMEEHGFREFFKWMFETFLSRPSSPPRRPLPRPNVTHVSYAVRENGNTRITNFELPIGSEQMTRIAKAVIAGHSFSEPGMCTKGLGLLSRPKFEELRGVLLERGLLAWNNPDNHLGGLDWTPGGRAFLREQARPTPTADVVSHTSPDANGCERTNANE